MVVKYMHHGDDLVEHRIHESSFGAQCEGLISFFFFFISSHFIAAWYFRGSEVHAS